MQTTTAIESPATTTTTTTTTTSTSSTTLTITASEITTGLATTVTQNTTTPISAPSTTQDSATQRANVTFTLQLDYGQQDLAVLEQQVRAMFVDQLEFDTSDISEVSFAPGSIVVHVVLASETLADTFETAILSRNLTVGDTAAMPLSLEVRRTEGTWKPSPPFYILHCAVLRAHPAFSLPLSHIHVLYDSPVHVCVSPPGHRRPARRAPRPSL